MDLQSFFEEFQDYLAPKLDTYEQAIYLYIFRHSRFKGIEEVVIGFKSSRKQMAFGVGESGKPMSEGVLYKKLRSLESKGTLHIIDSEYRGTKLKLFLPSEIVGTIPNIESQSEVRLDDMDFFGVLENRQSILKRENSRCFYCFRVLTDENFVIEHVVSRPEGNNGFRNLVAACKNCNDKKDNLSADEFIRALYRQNFLTSEELENRLLQLKLLSDGKLLPVFI